MQSMQRIIEVRCHEFDCFASVLKKQPFKSESLYTYSYTYIYQISTGKYSDLFPCTKEQKNRNTENGK